jgi:SAM-dependent methyltransferase
MFHSSHRNNKKRIRRLKRRIRRLSWFPSYQTFSELGIKGRRNDTLRYVHLDFSRCRDKLVVDYGCNLGQTSFLAARSGARRVIGFDCQADAIDVAREIQDVLGIKNVEFYKVDFNEINFGDKIHEIFNGEIPDISFFLSVYRTKELRDRDGLFKFILDNTREAVFFEGHSDRSIDTIDYYRKLFERFKVNADFLGYSQGDTRPLFIVWCGGLKGTR